MLQRIRTRLGRIFTPRPARKSHALHQLDLKLESYLNKRGGFFVEAGANDGARQNNTLYFEENLGWTGLLIEAIPSLADACRRNRPRCLVENCALVSAQYPSPTIEMDYLNLMSLVKDSLPGTEARQRHYAKAIHSMAADEPRYTVTVPARTLSQVLDAHGITHIDLLSLDVEGYEPEVLRGLDLARHRPDWLLIEVRDRPVVERLLAPYYRPVAVLQQNETHDDILYSALPL